MIDALEIPRQLQALVAYPREDLDMELKGWLDMDNEVEKANIAQAVLALANHGGGHLLIGFKEVDDHQWVVCDKRPETLGKYSQDRINDIVKSYAEPRFHCQLHHVPHSETELLYPVIVVPGGHKHPIRAKRDGPERKHVKVDTYYIRRPGPNSESPQTAKEWDELIGRCVRAAKDELLESFRQMMFGVSNPLASLPVEQKSIEASRNEALLRFDAESRDRWKRVVQEKLPNESPSRYTHGVWTVACGILEEITPVSLTELMEIMRKANRRVTGWPMWNPNMDGGGKPYAYNGAIEAFFWDDERPRFKDGVHSDFWRAAPEGMLFSLRGYEDDGFNNKGNEKGKLLDPILPIWRIGEAILHADRFAALVREEPSTITIKIEWNGLAGRKLASWVREGTYWVDEDLVSNQATVTSLITTNSEQIANNLPEVVQKATQPLYEVFGFFEMPIETVQEELSSMKIRK